MDLKLINFLSSTFGEQYVKAEELFRKSLNETAVPAMGHNNATLWIICDNVRGEDITRRHYEAMLRLDAEIDGEQQAIDPYGGPQTLVNRLRQQRFDIALTIFPPGFEKKVEYAELKLRQMRAEYKDVQLVCYNLEDRVMPTEEMEKQA